MVESLKLHNSTGYACFVDLSKAYDSVNRLQLFEIMANELGIDAIIVQQVQAMYKDTQMRILVGDQLSEAFQYGDGVRQGCPSIPRTIYSLHGPITDLPGLRAKVGGEARPPDAHTFLGWWLPILLFADDIVLLSKSKEGLQLLLNKLSDFAAQNSMDVNIEKTKWMKVGSKRILKRENQRSEESPKYRNETVERVRSFKYLGLHFDEQASTSHMMEKRLQAAKSSYQALHELLVRRGLRNMTTRLLLFDTYVRTTLLFAAPAWAAIALASNGTVRGDYTGKIGTFHRRKLRTILQVGTNIRNEIIYILSC